MLILKLLSYLSLLSLQVYLWFSKYKAKFLLKSINFSVLISLNLFLSFILALDKKSLSNCWIWYGGNIVVFTVRNYIFSLFLNKGLYPIWFTSILQTFLCFPCVIFQNYLHLHILFFLLLSFLQEMMRLVLGQNRL